MLVTVNLQLWLSYVSCYTGFCSSTVSNYIYVWLGISLIPKTSVILCILCILWYTLDMFYILNMKCFCGSMERYIKWMNEWYTLFKKKHINNYSNNKENSLKKKICTEHISYIYKQFTFVWYNLKNSGMQSDTLQSGYNHTVSFLSEISKIKTNNTPTAQTADHNAIVKSWLCSFLFFEIVQQKSQMAASNYALFHDSFHATQTQIQIVYVIVHMRIYRHELCSGMGRTASQKRLSLNRTWASKC